jgi:hypothetical protein
MNRVAALPAAQRNELFALTAERLGYRARRPADG